MSDDQFQQFMGTIRKPGRKLDTLASVDPADWLTWRAHAVTVIDINNWENARAKQEIKAALTGKAGEYLRSIVVPPGAPTRLLDAYEARLLPAAAGDAARIALTTARQREDEPVIEWHARLRTLYERAYPNKTAAETEADIDLKHRFILGLADDAARERVWYHRPADYSAALADADNVVQGGHILRMAAGVKTEPKAMHAIKQEAEAGPGGAGATQEPVAAMRGAPRRGCWTCGAEDHIQRFCPRPGPPGIRGRGGYRGRGGRGAPPPPRRYVPYPPRAVGPGPRGARGRGSSGRGRAGRRPGGDRDVLRRIASLHEQLEDAVAQQFESDDYDDDGHYEDYEAGSYNEDSYGQQEYGYPEQHSYEEQDQGNF